MSQMRLRRANLLDKRQNGPRRERARATESEQRTSSSARPVPKVVDRNVVLDYLSQLRDELDRVMELVNDLAVRASLPSNEDEEWLDAGELSEEL